MRKKTPADPGKVKKEKAKKQKIQKNETDVIRMKEAFYHERI